MSEGSASTSIRSAWVIWPIFSASVIRREQVVDPLLRWTAWLFLYAG